MLFEFDFSLIDWSRAQFALTAMYHWIFVPLTLGITFIIAIMETIYVRTGQEQWKRITKFWMTLFGINFAIGVATGIILEFEFGTNWSNYSWFVGDIFGAPLAIEGIMAFFMESTFIAVMFFGWNRVSKKFHLTATWLTAIGANLSALWILVANAWMQYPAGMEFNPDTARNEMVNFWDVALSPMAINKFLHTITSSYTLAALFVIGISSFFLIRKRHVDMAKKSIIIAGIFGLMASSYTVLTGDGSATQVAEKQPMKFAAMEGLYDGKEGAGLVLIGALKDADEDSAAYDKHEFMFKLEAPKMLSLLATRKADGFVPGINDLMEGNPKWDILPVKERIAKGKIAIQALADYKAAKAVLDDSAATQADKDSAEVAAAASNKLLMDNFEHFGYGYFDGHEDLLVPNVPMTFYSFHIMVALGFLFILIFVVFLWKAMKNKLEKGRLWLRIGVLMMPLAYVASMAGWIVAEVGRQPWVIQDLMPTLSAVSRIDSGAVQTTFWIFAVVFTALLIAEISIMVRQIKIGPKEKEGGE
jgi:cytochrome d ubiquinol oxidase subunit I